MAHNPVGAGASVTLAASSANLSDSFAVKSNTIRLFAHNADAFVAINTGGTAATLANYAVPSGTTATHFLSKGSASVHALAGSATSTAETVITLPEGTEYPFNTDDYLTVEDTNDSNWNLSHVKIISITSDVSPDGYNQPKITVDADTSGISTAYNGATPGSVRKSFKISAYGLGAGSLYYQQVQVSGDA
tara:strand:+ start:870 stop:1439 length:570 start_codon:yes stop_codon:yes gene_type:complete